MFGCPSCGESFEKRQSMRLHHYHKHNESIAKEQSVCKVCGSSFEYYEQEKKGIYCPDCADNSWGNENLLCGFGEENPNWRGGPVESECSVCGKDIEVTKTNYEKYNNHFCSKECESKRKSEEYEGSGNPNYIDGESKQRNYGKGWKRAKKKALERDNYQCVICGKGKEKLGKNPSVHHKIPVRKFDNPQDAHYLDNLVCLCEQHHPQVEHSNRKI